MKSELTRKIEDKLSRWYPSKIGNFEIALRRQQYKGFEVPVTHGSIKDGIIDCVWCAEGFINRAEKYECAYKSCFLNNSDMLKNYKCNTTHEERMVLQECIGDYKCRYRCKTITKENVCYTICFEIKISIEDFHSPNGHNFVGNLNYYIVPKSIYPVVAKETPENIGIISYDEVNDKFFVKKPAFYRKIENDDYIFFLQSIVNKETKKLRKEVADTVYDFSRIYDVAQTALLNIKTEFPDTSTKIDSFRRRLDRIYDKRRLT